MAVLLEVAYTVALLALYLTVVTGVGLAMRLVGRNPLKHSVNDGGFWQRHRGAGDRGAMERPS